MKHLTLGKRLTNGRNNTGRITVDHRGGGVSHAYRLVDFKRTFKNVKALVLQILKDPNRTGAIALVLFDNGFLTYMLSTEHLKKGDSIIFGETAPLLPGNALKLKNIPFGLHISSLDLFPASSSSVNKNNSSKKGAILARSAGCSAQILKRSGSFSLIKLMSNELRWVHSEGYASLGVISPFDHQFVKLKKAGNNRWRGRKPIVRGTAKNPVDHPHGGGQGKTAGGRCSVTPWAQLTKGKRTRSKTKNSVHIYRFRYHKK